MPKAALLCRSRLHGPDNTASLHGHRCQKHSIEGGYIFTVRGEGDDGAGYRFAKIELITDKAEYAPGRHGAAADQYRPQGRCGGAVCAPGQRGLPAAQGNPHELGKSALWRKLQISKKDMPNFFVEAVTVYDGKVHTDIREIVVPPEKRVLNVKVTPSKTDYRPGQKAKLNVQLTDFYGEPFQGSTVISVYDRAVEYISGGSNVPEISSAFSGSGGGIIV